MRDKNHVKPRKKVSKKKTQYMVLNTLMPRISPTKRKFLKEWEKRIMANAESSDGN